MTTPRERLYNRILGYEPGHNGIPIPVEDVELILDWACEFFTPTTPGRFQLQRPERRRFVLRHAGRHLRAD